ncbi:MAG: hypothetical protein ABI443_06960 [Chthoniobacterales bacterium]
MRFRYVALGLLLSVSVVFAGAGPPPFTNGSPLSSGIDGTYNAIARGTNLTGVISFAIQSGIQVGTVAGNGWTFFVDGQILQGNTTVTISDGDIAGILNGGGIPSALASKNLTFPVIFDVAGNASAGEFTGKLDQTSPTGAITGSGILEGTPGRTDQLVIISALTLDGSGGVGGGLAGVDVIPIVIPGSSLATSNFTFRGTRQSTDAIENGQASATASP